MGEAYSLRYSQPLRIPNIASPPENFVSHIQQRIVTSAFLTCIYRSFSGGIALRVTYGYNIATMKDERRSVIIAGMYLVDYIPALEYVPCECVGSVSIVCSANGLAYSLVSRGQVQTRSQRMGKACCSRTSDTRISICVYHAFTRNILLLDFKSDSKYARLALSSRLLTTPSH